ncbi:MAG: hypothetical protein JRH05_16845 [Deltaproteobacteria bacterium]|nr:hypothetical protein [Deltaproteobacteria bacterium]
MKALKALPLGEKTTSLHYKTGPLKGYVKEAFKPWETLFLGPMSLDFLVGMDKVYGYGSDAGKFSGFLRFNGWRL